MRLFNLIRTYSQYIPTWIEPQCPLCIRPRHLTSIATSLQRIIAACEDIVNIHDAITFVLQQSLCAPETVTKIQDSTDGSMLFFAHSFSVTMWDVQTDGLIHTFTTQSKINDFAVSATGGHIACGLSDCSVTFWDIHTKDEGKGFGNGQPVVAIHWLFPLEPLVATQSAVYVHEIDIDRTWDSLPTPGPVWGMVCSVGGREFLVGTSRPGGGAGQEIYTLEPTRYTGWDLDQWQRRAPPGWKPPISMSPGRLMCPIRVGNKIACITPLSGVQLFDTDSNNWTNKTPLLDATISLAVSLNRNLVVQTKDSIQIFSLDVLETGKAHDDIHLSHIYPMGEKYIVCLQPDRQLTLPELDTLQELHPNDNTSILKTLLTDQSTSACTPVGGGPIAELGISAVMQAWQSGLPLPSTMESADEDELLSGLSPNHTWVVTVYNSPRQEILVKDVGDGITLASAPLEHESVVMGKVYDLTFDSDTRFYLKVEGPGWHIQIPYNIIASPSESYSHTITQGEPEPLSEP